MSSGQWLTYEDAAAQLGMTRDSLRHRAGRERWEKQPNDEGKMLVLVPLRAIPDLNAATVHVPPPPRAKPAGADLIVEHLARISEIGAKMGDLLAALDGAHHSQQGRADRPTGEIADLVRQFAETMATAQGRADAERDRGDRLAAELASARARIDAERERADVAEREREELRVEKDRRIQLVESLIAWYRSSWLHKWFKDPPEVWLPGDRAA